jgi:hypothetical protein
MSERSSAEPLELIVTHPGGAHKDDFLACCVLIALHPVAIERRDSTADDLANPAIAVVDQGDEHTPDRANFDHHQFPREAEPRCALSLVLDYLGLYDDAKQFCGWLTAAEWFDCRGANGTAQWLGVEREVIERLTSPIDITLLRRFAAEARCDPGQPLWEIMRWIGDDLLTYVKTQRQQIERHRESAVLWSLGTPETPLEVVFISRESANMDDPTAGLDAFIIETYGEGVIQATIYPDRRGPGYGLKRFRDHPTCDFNRIRHEVDVTFVHNSGFVAKSTAAEIDRLKALVIQAGGLKN